MTLQKSDNFGKEKKYKKYLKKYEKGVDKWRNLRYTEFTTKENKISSIQKQH